MNRWLIILVGVAYTVVAINYARRGRVGDAVVFAGYALALVGFILND